MEENIKRVEKLVHATNSALAQMKFNLMFDDVPESGKGGKAKKYENFHTLESLLGGNDLRHCQNEFKSQANDILAKMEMFGGPGEPNRKTSKARERIKEINKKMSHLRLEQPKPVETEQSREKLLSLVSEEKFSPGIMSSKDSDGSKHGMVAFKDDLPEKPQRSPAKSKLELKNKILETQEIVDRGFQTARELAAKVESMSKCERKSPSTGKTVSEINVKSLERKTESNDTIKSVKCKKHSAKRNKTENTRVIDIKRKEVQQCARSNLQLQRLPSLNIKGGLKCQKVHCLEIPASEETISGKSNTGVISLSHEQMEKEKLNKVVERLQRENDCCVEKTAGNYIECFNCGKLIRIRETRPDPRTVDEILKKCDFNVFDPRIDEFVEKQGTIDLTSCEGPPSPPPVEIKSKDVGVMVKTREYTPKSRRFTLRDLSDQLCRKYKEQADNLEDNHLKLDIILQNLFKKVDESREVFEDCHLFRNTKKIVELTATEPVLVNLVENPQSRKKLDKKDVRNRNKSRTKNPRVVETIKHSEESSLTSLEDQPEQVVRERSIEKTLIMDSLLSEPAQTPSFENEETSAVRKEEIAIMTSSPSQIDSGKVRLESLENQSKFEIEKMSEKSENNYESDFESTEEEEPEMIPCVKKLSTISEVDSELEKKPSDEQTAPKLDNSWKEEADLVAPSKKTTPPKTADPTPKSTPTELVTSLKDILSALQDQFARTESLAEKLTVNKPDPPAVRLSPWNMLSPDKLVENLQSARKDLIAAEKQVIVPSGSDFSEDVTETGGSSIGEIVVCNRRKRNSGGSSVSEISFLNLESEKSVDFG